MLESPPDILNLSLNGPYDPLLERLIQKAIDAGVVVVAAGPVDPESQNSFPSNMRQVIGVGVTPTDASIDIASGIKLFAPGNRILVAVPTNQYDFRSGSSLAAAEVSGVIALILANSPGHSADSISNILQRSQVVDMGPELSINACDALNLAGHVQHCNN
jgi:subtilisin family serine protease